MEELLKQGILLCGNCKYCKGRRYVLTNAERDAFIVTRFLSRHSQPPDIESLRIQIFKRMKRVYDLGQLKYALEELEKIQGQKHSCKEFKEEVSPFDIAYKTCSMWQPFNGRETYPSPILEKYF